MEQQKGIKSVAEEDALRKLLASDEEDEDEGQLDKKDGDDDKDEDEENKEKDEKVNKFYFHENPKLEKYESEILDLRQSSMIIFLSSNFRTKINQTKIWIKRRTKRRKKNN